jgi:hypothetical protein
MMLNVVDHFVRELLLWLLVMLLRMLLKLIVINGLGTLSHGVLWRM